MFWLFSVVQAPPSPSQRASTPRCQQAPSQTWRTLLPATSTSRRRGSSGRRCPSKMSFLGRPSQLGESEKDRRLVARGTTVASQMHQHSVIACCPPEKSFASPTWPLALSFSNFQQEQLKYLKYFQQTFDLCEREKPEEGGGRCVQAGPDLYVG